MGPGPRAVQAGDHPLVLQLQGGHLPGVQVLRVRRKQELIRDSPDLHGGLPPRQVQQHVQGPDADVVGPGGLHRRSTKSTNSFKVTEWSDWSPCSASCGKGWITKTRQILAEPQHGGRQCPRKLEKRKKRRGYE